MRIRFENHDLETEGCGQFIDLTDDVVKVVERSQVRDGMAVVYSHRSYGEYSEDTSKGWMNRKGEAIERELMSWTGMPKLAQLRAPPKSK